jgi:hypothetical protein
MDVINFDDFLKESKALAREPSLIQLIDNKLPGMLQVLESFIKVNILSSKARYLFVLLKVVKILRVQAKIEDFVTKQSEFELMTRSNPPELINKIESFFINFPNDVAPKDIALIALYLSKAYEPTTKPELYSSFLSYWQLQVLKNILSKERIAELEKSFGDKVMEAIKDANNFKAYADIFTANKIGPVIPILDYYKYIIVKLGQKKFMNSSFYFFALNDWIQKPVAERLNLQVVSYDEKLDSLVDDFKLSSKITDRTTTKNLVDIIFDNKLLWPKFNFALFEGLIEFLSSLSALNVHESTQFRLSEQNYRAFSSKTTDLKALYQFFSVIFSIEKAKEPEGHYDLEALANINDDIQAYMLWNTVLSPKVSIEKPFDEEFLQESLYKELKERCQREIIYRGYQYIIEASGPYFKYSDLKEFYYN